MATSTPNPGPPASRAPSLYLATWGILAAFALGYLALLALRPDLAASLIVGPSEGSPEGNRGQRAMTRALAELNGVKQTIARLEGEVAELRTTLAAEHQRGEAIAARLASVETTQIAAAAPAMQGTLALPQTTAGLGAVETAPAAATARGQFDERATKALREGRTAEAPREPATLSAQAAATGAGALPEASNRGAAKALEPKPKGPPVGLWVGTGPSLDAVRLSWQLLQETHKGSLKALEPRYVENSTDPPAFQLIAGPVATREEAAKVCERLRAKQARCSVVPFTGQTL